MEQQQQRQRQQEQEQEQEQEQQQQQQRHLAGEGVVQGRTVVPIVVKSTRHQRGCYFFSPRERPFTFYPWIGKEI